MFLKKNFAATLIEADQDDLEDGLDVRLGKDIVYHTGKDNKQPSLLEADERVKTETNDNNELSFSEENNNKSQGDVFGSCSGAFNLRLDIFLL